MAFNCLVLSVIPTDPPHRSQGMEGIGNVFVHGLVRFGLQRSVGKCMVAVALKHLQLLLKMFDVREQVPS